MMASVAEPPYPPSAPLPAEPALPPVAPAPALAAGGSPRAVLISDALARERRALERAAADLGVRARALERAATA